MAQSNQTVLFKLAKRLLDRNSDNSPCIEFEAAAIVCNISEIFIFVAISHLAHLILKRLGQPSIVSQMLAGFFIGPSLLGRLNLLRMDMKQLESIAMAVRIFFMFLVGLEIDISYLKHRFRSTAKITASTVMICMPLSIVTGVLLFRLTHTSSRTVPFALIIFIVFFNSASPIVIRIVNELKLTSTEIGRLAISTVLVTEVMCLALLGFLDITGMGYSKLISNQAGLRNVVIMLAFLLFGISVIAIRLTVKWVNKRNGHRCAIGDKTVLCLLSIVFAWSAVTQSMGFNPMLGACIFGIMVPRDGPTARTIIERLTYVVENLMLPIYFGTVGLQVDVHYLRHTKVVITTVLVISFGMIGKIGGTMAGARFLGIPMLDGLILSFLLNIKGPVNHIIISFARNHDIWSDETHMAFLVSMFLNSLISCPAIAILVRQERKKFQYRFKGLERLSPESDLRMLACVHSPSDVPTMLDLIEISNSPDRFLLAPYILHLMEFKGCATSTMLYHQLQEQDNNNKLGGNQAQQVNIAIDTFIRKTNIHLNHRTAISRFDTMHKDLKLGVQEVRAALAIVPFHCKQRFDGKMGVGKDDIRQFNINVLNQVHCSIGILVDRGLDWIKRSNGYDHNVSSTLSSNGTTLLDVVVLFLGGPDDREAASYAARLAMHPGVNVTIMRFLPAFGESGGVYLHSNSVHSESNCITMKVETSDADETFMASFYNRFVVTGIMTYVERSVENSTELVTALSSMGGVYSLYIVGRRREGPTAQLTTGLNDWEECPELGTIGDLLASSDFMLNGSVLVVQQHSRTS